MRIVRATLDGSPQGYSKLQARLLKQITIDRVGSALTIGNFDGVHLGHQHLLSKLKEASRRGKHICLAISFYPHPADHFATRRGEHSTLGALSSVREKAVAMERQGVDLLLLIRFTDSFSQISADQFFDCLVVGALNAKELIFGPDVTLGAGRAGDANFLKHKATPAGINLEIVQMVESGLSKISSREIRRLLRLGEVRGAAQMLGANYQLEGRVVTGDGRGRTIGVPTANLQPVLVGSRFPSRVKIIPALGVYAVYAEFRGITYKAVANLGVRPTFQKDSATLGSNDFKLEVHLLDYSGAEFYGERLTVAFVDRLRPEKKFESVADLKRQIEDDIKLAREKLQ